MFREMLRFKQALSDEACVDILRKALRGVLSVNGDDGYPYAMPINHYYCEEDGHIYFHGGRLGHKIDALRRDERACFCVMDEGERAEEGWWLRIRSVVVFGRVRFVEDHGRAMDISRRLSHKFTQDEDYIEYEVAHSGPGTLVFELVPEHMTGKLVNER